MIVNTQTGTTICVCVCVVFIIRCPHAQTINEPHLLGSVPYWHAACAHELSCTLAPAPRAEEVACCSMVSVLPRSKHRSLLWAGLVYRDSLWGSCGSFLKLEGLSLCMCAGGREGGEGSGGGEGGERGQWWEARGEREEGEGVEVGKQSEDTWSHSHISRPIRLLHSKSGQEVKTKYLDSLQLSANYYAMYVMAHLYSTCTSTVIYVWSG